MKEIALPTTTFAENAVMTASRVSAVSWCIARSIYQKGERRTMIKMENEINVTVPLEVVKASEIEPKEVKWLWYPYIPFGKVTLLQGDPGDGKSKLMLSIAALLSKGEALGNINAHYYIEYTIESLDVERLEQMINLVISKNDALRLIVTHEGKASFLDNVPYYSVPVYSLYDGNDREQKRLERSHHRYNYYKWPMFHFCVGKTSGKTSVLHVDFDCIILDAWSAKLLLNEIFSLYYGKDVKFPRISFMNYMRLKTDKGDLEAEEYWKEKVKNMPSFPKLNYQKKFAEVQNVRFDRIECDFSFIETQRLYQKIKNYHFTPAAVISTIFMKTLAQYSETPGLSINVTLFNRQLLHEDVNGILGEFTNNAVISYQEKTDSLLDAIRATQEQMWRLVQYRKFEGSNILKMLSSGRAGKAIMPVVFTCMLEGNVSKVTKKRYSFKEEYAISQTPQVVLDHHVRDDLGYLKISWDYIIDIFDKQYITDIFGAYVNNIKKFMEKY